MFPWNVSFAAERLEPAIATHERLTESTSYDSTRALARTIVMTEPEAYSAALLCWCHGLPGARSSMFHSKTRHTC